MSLRTTIYCNDETEEKLNHLMELAESNPARWSYITGQAAPTNFNQLITALVDLGYRQLRQNSQPEMVAESVPLWQAVNEVAAQAPDEAWDQLPADLAASLDHYLYDAPKGS
jgi:hypothetical protein